MHTGECYPLYLRARILPVSYFRDVSKTFQISFTDVQILSKRMVSTAYSVHKKSCSKILNLSMSWSDLKTDIEYMRK